MKKYIFRYNFPQLLGYFKKDQFLSEPRNDDVNFSIYVWSEIISSFQHKAKNEIYSAIISANNEHIYLIEEINVCQGNIDDDVII